MTAVISTREDFLAHVQSGGKVDATDWMPEDYRDTVARVVSFQALAEVFGAYVQSAALMKAPTFLRKLIFTAKIQDEMGHGMYLMRVCEELGLSREQIIEEFLAGKRKVLSVWHFLDDDWYHFPTWSWLGNVAAMEQFKVLREGSYLPYARALARIMTEEAFHYQQAIDLTLTLTRGTPEEVARLQEGLDIWWYRVLEFFGPPETDERIEHNPAVLYRVKMTDNESLRQKWLTRVVKIIESMPPLRVPDPELRWDEEARRWHYTAPDWDDFARRVKHGGPDFAQLRDEFARAYHRHDWVRQGLAASV